MKLHVLLLIITGFWGQGFAQRFEYHYLDLGDSTNGYLKLFPESDDIKGLIIRDYSSLPDMSKPSRYQFSELAIEAGFMVLYTVSSSAVPELFCEDQIIARLDQMVGEVVQEHAIPANAIFIGGISASGTRALRYAQYCEAGKSAYGIRINSVFVVDSPIDLERFYRSAHDHHDNFKEGMLWESNLMMQVFPQLFGGSPDEVPEKYREASVFSQTDPTGGNAHYLKDIPMLVYHEPDIDWWLNERGATYYDINSYDLAAFVLTLRQLGNSDVQLITTTGKGYDAEGNRNCHSWTIVDEPQLIKWLSEHLK